ncbi:cysteine hydrolase family protein [Mycobacterium spongiae]|uniref:Isochorismatase family protein n=1 Tax=Mycobacterium spongiae TaxID=886343 RepID=A0A975JY79_9MYCO|nr:isochorismatase family protein [Mycobacterium spongiae]QUR67905.1 isochorismatase family protein [Mycobacterium spongiae]
MDMPPERDERSPVCDRSAGPIDPVATALVAIDCQGRFGPYLVGGKLENVIRLIHAAHAAKMPVVLTQHSDVDPDSVLSRFWRDDIVHGSDDWRLLPQVPVGTDDLLIQDKHTYDAFMRTSLERHLRERGITTLIVTGAMTNLCCETTSRSAFTRDFDVIFVDDANGTRNDAMHRASVDNLRFLGCRIMTTDGVVAAMAASTGSSKEAR